MSNPTERYRSVFHFRVFFAYGLEKDYFKKRMKKTKIIVAKL